MEQNEMLPDERTICDYEYSSSAMNFNRVTSDLEFVTGSVHEFSHEMPGMNEFSTSLQPINYYSGDDNHSYQQLNQTNTEYNEVMTYYPLKNEPIESNTSYSVCGAEIHPSQSISPINYVPVSCTSTDLPLSGIPSVHVQMDPMPNYSFEGPRPDMSTVINTDAGHRSTANSELNILKGEFQDAPLDIYEEQFHYQITSQDDYSSSQTYTMNDLQHIKLSNISTENTVPIDSSDLKLRAAQKVGNFTGVSVKCENEDQNFSNEVVVGVDKNENTSCEHPLHNVHTEEMNVHYENENVVVETKVLENVEVLVKTEPITRTVNGQSNELKIETQDVPICIRNGCKNAAVNNPEWEQEFCSNNCVVIHCRNVFMAWIKANEVNNQ